MRIATFIAAGCSILALSAAAQAPDELMRELEDSARPETQAFFREEGARTRATLDKLPGRASLLGRIRALSLSSVEITSFAASNTSRIFYLQRSGIQPVPMLYFREKVGAPEKVLVDPSRFAKAGAGAPAIDWFVPSPDGRHVAYGISLGGREDSVLHVIAVDGAEDMHIEIDRARLNTHLAWHPDGKSFFYARIPQVEEGPRRWANVRVYRHVLGRDASKDEIVFAPGVGGARDVPEFAIPSIYIPPDSKQAYAVVHEGVRREIALHETDLRELSDAKPRWRKLAGFEDQVLDVVGSSDDLFLLSRQAAPRRKVLRLKGGKDLNTARVAIPQGDSVIRTVAIARDAIYLRTMVAGVDRLERVAISLLGNTKTAEYVRTPFDTSITQLVANPRTAGVLLRLQGWIEPPTIIHVDTQGESHATGLQPAPPSAADFDAMDEVRLYAPLADGTKIPVTLIYRKSTTLTRENPTLLEAFGSYGYSMTPVFDATRLAWLERGGILAVAHVRGGGEYGETWHEAAVGAAKGNTIGDFIAVSEFLIHYGFTNPKRLAVLGTGAGAIAVAGAFARRPDLYAAAILRSPMTDMLRYETMPSGPAYLPEFGSRNGSMGLEQLGAISALHQLKDGTAYPAAMIVVGMNDGRVAPWQGAKMAARLQSASTSGKPVLMRVDPESGYGDGVTLTQRDDELADVYSFLLWQMGDATFQPPGTVPAAPAPQAEPAAPSSAAAPEAAPAAAPAESTISQPPLNLPPSMFAPKPNEPAPK
jgi:prolyl oligopeptidase